MENQQTAEVGQPTPQRRAQRVVFIDDAAEVRRGPPACRCQRPDHRWRQLTPLPSWRHQPHRADSGQHVSEAFVFQAAEHEGQHDGHRQLTFERVAQQRDCEEPEGKVDVGRARVHPEQRGLERRRGHQASRAVAAATITKRLAALT